MDRYSIVSREDECILIADPSGDFVLYSDVSDAMSSVREQTIVDCMGMIAGMRKEDNPGDLPTIALNIVVDLSVGILSSCLDLLRRR